MVNRVSGDESSIQASLSTETEPPRSVLIHSTLKRLWSEILLWFDAGNSQEVFDGKRIRTVKGDLHDLMLWVFAEVGDRRQETEGEHSRINEKSG